MVDLSVQLAPRHPRGLLLANPVMAASGTFGYGTEYSELIDVRRLGAIVCKGTTLHPRKGNPQPRVVETACGLLNSIGLENIGVDAVVKLKAPVWAGWKVPVIVNIAGESIEEYQEIASRVDGVAGIAGVELNISCPNVARGVEFASSSELAFGVTQAVRQVTGLPLIVKLSPNVTDIAEIALAVSQAGADVVSLVNTLRGMAIDVKGRRPVLGGISGGLSGAAIKPVALYMVYRVSQVVDITVIGCGGIMTAADAIEFILAGATAVQVGSANLANPRATLDIVSGIEQFMEQEGVASLRELVGAAHH